MLGVPVLVDGVYGLLVRYISYNQGGIYRSGFVGSYLSNRLGYRLHFKRKTGFIDSKQPLCAAALAAHPSFSLFVLNGYSLSNISKPCTADRKRRDGGSTIQARYQIPMRPYPACSRCRLIGASTQRAAGESHGGTQTPVPAPQSLQVHPRIR